MQNRGENAQNEKSSMFIGVMTRGDLRRQPLKSDPNRTAHGVGMSKGGAGRDRLREGPIVRLLDDMNQGRPAVEAECRERGQWHVNRVLHATSPLIINRSRTRSPQLRFRERLVTATVGADDRRTARQATLIEPELIPHSLRTTALIVDRVRSSLRRTRRALRPARHRSWSVASKNESRCHTCRRARGEVLALGLPARPTRFLGRPAPS